MSTTGTSPERPVQVESLEKVVIRFAGDSGDGMQLTGSQFTHTSALIGNDLSTFPDFPAEIRAPAGTVAGVSGFQVHIGATDVSTPGDAPDVLVAMNPAALKVNINDLKPNGIVIVNSSAFRGKNLELAGYHSNPLEDGSLDKYRLFKIDLTIMTRKAVEPAGVSQKEADRCKNFFALGMMYWLYNRSLDTTLRYITEQFAKKPQIAEANRLALEAGYSFCSATEAFQISYDIAPAKLPPGKYRNINGNSATALGLVAAAQRAGLPLFLGTYPITPASEILQDLSKYKNFNVFTFQAEDEIAGITSAIGASFAGALAATSTSGPGMALKGEGIGLAIMTELPLVIIDVQRGGPSTGLPTKTEQADLFQAVFGRNSEAPVPVVAACSPADCFTMAVEASRLALKYMTPVILLTDGYLAFGAEPWRIPAMDSLPEFQVNRRTDPEGFEPYRHDPKTLARPWAVPGTPGLEHRIGGLEKWDVTGNISYDPLNHEHMVRLRANRVANIANDIPALEVDGPETGELLLCGWGSTYGAITGAVAELRRQGFSVSQAHFKYLNPMPRNTESVLRRFKKILIPEMNMGQLAFLLRGHYLVDPISYPKVQGKPFKISEIVNKAREVLEAK